MSQKLEFIALEPQPIGHLRYREGAEHSDMEDSTGHRYPIPEGWGVIETTTETIAGQVCFVRMETPETWHDKPLVPGWYFQGHPRMTQGLKYGRPFLLTARDVELWDRMYRDGAMWKLYGPIPDFPVCNEGIES